MQNGAGRKKGKTAPRVLAVLLVIAAVVGAYYLKNGAGGKAPVDYGVEEFNLDVTFAFDFEKIMSHGLPVLMDFGAEGCYACEQFMPALKDLNRDLRGSAIVKYVDVWKDQAAADGFPLMYIPTQFFFDKDGNPYMPEDIEAAEAEGFVLYQDQNTGAHILTAHIGPLTYERAVAILKEMGMQ